MNIALVFAGGVGVRMGATIPKQFLKLNGRPVLAHTLDLFQHHTEIDSIYLVVAEEHVDTVRKLAMDNGITKLKEIVFGGESAQDSIYNGLCSLIANESPDSIVLIHDGVRPYVEHDVISANIAATKEFGNAITYTPCFETIVLSTDGSTIDKMPYRRESYTAQAPQTFKLSDILAAHDSIRAREGGYTDMIDQATICYTLGIRLHLVAGNRGNIKVTTPEDLHMLGALLSARKEVMS